MKKLCHILTGLLTLALNVIHDLSSQPLPAPVKLNAGSDYLYLCRDAGAGGAEEMPDICRTASGKLIVVFLAGFAHASPPTPTLPKGGRICYAFSADEGKTWTNPQILADTGEDDRDPSIVKLADGTLFCTFINSTPEAAWKGTLFCTSRNNGKSWSAPQRLIENFLTSQPPRILSTGEIILPLYRQDQATANGAVMISKNSTATWSKAIEIDNNGLYLNAETDVIQLKNGDLYAVQRAQHGIMQFSISKDKGESWSISQPLPFAGITPCLLRSTGGIIVLAYGPVFENKRWSTGLRYSLDECRTWSDLVMADHVLGCHPTLVNLKDGSILLGYYDENTGPLPSDRSDIRLRKFSISPEGITWLSWSHDRK